LLAAPERGKRTSAKQLAEFRKGKIPRLEKSARSTTSLHLRPNAQPKRLEKLARRAHGTSLATDCPAETLLETKSLKQAAKSCG